MVKNLLADIQPEPDMVPMEMIKPFGPSIAKTQMEPELVQALNVYFDKMGSLPEDEYEEYDHQFNLAGNVQKEFELVIDHFPEYEQLGTLLMTMAGQCYLDYATMKLNVAKMSCTPFIAEILDKKFEQIDLTVHIKSSWCVQTHEHDFNPTHQHTGSYSGVGYTALPDGIEDEWAREDHDASAGMLHFWESRGMEFTEQQMKVRPKVGDIYMFPSWLPHCVYPYRTPGQRRSFSFNIDVQNKNPLTELTPVEKDLLREHLKK